ncbi:XAC0095 family protein [Luteimonas fraxinea]|uniref:XAC0095-like domain-containing protein n=1 Tax=Luteimonas fraxinea TaxID=2901869 RepID=A0ABS8UBC7_9GAMM|nr:hypothetical protein [Luteimonas fraxinea]MCD9096793.1 hypothetical protein [Luteimonas fraxinea]MCD9126161.1 hypothetical protein [Luteimonas fraxinea]
MSKFETEDRGALGYFLSEDGQSRLRKLHQHIEFLSRLAEPRVDEEEDGPEIDHPALAGCMDLLAEQVQLVLDTVSWPARLQAKGKRGDDQDEADDDHDDHDDDDSDEDEAEDVDVDASDDVEEAVATEPGGAKYLVGMTLRQIDEATNLLDMLVAQGDLLHLSGTSGTEFTDNTIAIAGASIFDSAQVLQALHRQVISQYLTDRPAARPRVRETPPLYNVHVTATAKPQGEHRAH